MRSPITAALVCALACPSPPAMAAEEGDWLFMKPTTAWQPAMDGESCSLVRGFQNGQRKGQAEIRRYGPASGFELTLFVSGAEVDEDAEAVTLRFSEDEEWREERPSMLLRSGDYAGFILATSFDKVSVMALSDDAKPADDDADDDVRSVEDPYARAEREKAATGIWIRDGLGEPVQFRTGSMLAPMMLLRECTDALVAKWGYDPVAYHAQTRRANVRDLHKWVRFVIAEYPTGPDRRMRNGAVRLRLDIDAEGKATDCTPQSELAGPEFYRAACKIIKSRGRFWPALDGNGNPVASFYSLSIMYQVN